MQSRNITKPFQTKVRSRVGRGIAAGQGKTAGRGTKGQNSRTGKDLPRRFEGGQTPLTQRLPKLNGFRSIHPKAITVNYAKLEALFEDGAAVTPNLLRAAGLPVKVVASSNMKKKFKFSRVGLSEKVKEYNK